MVRSKDNAEKTMLSAARGFAVLLAVCACCIFGGVTASAQEVGTDAYVNAPAMNLQEAPYDGSPDIRTLPRSTIVSILEREGAWVRVFVQGANGGPVEGWLKRRFLGWDADTITRLTPRGGYERGHQRGHQRGHGSGRFHPPHAPAKPLRVSKFDFDCRAAVFGNSGITKCGASARVQLLPQEFDPDRSDIVPVVCRGAITYQTEYNQNAQRMVAVERLSIAHNDRLGGSARLDFDVDSIREKIVSAQLLGFSCVRD